MLTSRVGCGCRSGRSKRVSCRTETPGTWRAAIRRHPRPGNAPVKHGQQRDRLDGRAAALAALHAVIQADRAGRVVAYSRARATMSSAGMPVRPATRSGVYDLHALGQQIEPNCCLVDVFSIVQIFAR